MRRALLVGLLLALAGGCSRRQTSSAVDQPPSQSEQAAPSGDASREQTSPLAQKVDALFADAARDETFSGSVVVVDAGKTVLLRGYGKADRENAKLDAADTIFRVGSLTKQFTASAILALAKDGKLDVGDPVAKFFPEYPKESLVKEGVEVTLHHLLSHTSGLPDGRETDYFKANVWKLPIDKGAVIAHTRSLPLVRKPGTKFEYLNYGYFLLGIVLERVSGESYEGFLRRRFFAPFGMKDTGTLLPTDAKDRAALGYHKALLGGLTTMARDPSFRDRDVTFAFGSGQIYSTVSDLALWDRALADGKVTGQEQLFKANLDDYGYGWVTGSAKGVAFAWHNGALSPLGFSSFLIRIPSKQRMIAYLSNLDIEVTEPLEAKVAKLAID
jgi:D-alanyl-D-alanine carboxypeptidase